MFAEEQLLISGRSQPAKESGGCSDCSSGCVAAHPGTDSVKSVRYFTQRAGFFLF